MNETFQDLLQNELERLRKRLLNKHKEAIHQVEPVGDCGDNSLHAANGHCKVCEEQDAMWGRQISHDHDVLEAAQRFVDSNDCESTHFPSEKEKMISTELNCIDPSRCSKGITAPAPKCKVSFAGAGMCLGAPLAVMPCVVPEDLISEDALSDGRTSDGPLSDGPLSDGPNHPPGSRPSKSTCETTLEECTLSDRGSGNGLGDEFVLRTVWSRSKDKKNEMAKMSGTRTCHLRYSEGSSAAGPQILLDEEEEDSELADVLDHPDILLSKGRMRHLILHPYSLYRGFWDLSNLMFVGHDMVTLPLAFFDLPGEAYTSFSLWLVRLFWTCDLPLNFFTGYVKVDGIIEMRPSVIMWRYFSTWFILDVILVLTDWLEAVQLGAFRMAKATRAFRIIRMLRLMRMAKMKKTLSGILERCPSEMIYLSVDILQIISAMVFFAHLVACVWYGIGSQDDERTWVKSYFGEQEAEDSISLRYAVSLHWSLSQFTGGMDEVRAFNLSERSFAVCTFLLFFIMSALFVSSLTSLLTRLHIISSQKSRQVSRS